MKKSNEPVRGTKDYLPREMMLREKVKSIILTGTLPGSRNHARGNRPYGRGSKSHQVAP